MARQPRKKAQQEPEVLEPRPAPLDNDRWERFCHEYLVDFHITNAARRAGFAKSTAKQQGSRLLTRVDVRARIAYLHQVQLRAVDMDAETWKREILRLATADPRRMFNDDGTLLKPSEWPDDVAATIAGVETRELWDWDPVEQERVFVGYTQKVRRESKTKALELMARHLKLLTDNLHLTADDELVEALQRGRRRAGRA